MFKRARQDRCYALYINETSRKVEIKKVRTEEGLIHLKNKSWIVKTDPLFYKKNAFYIISDKKLMAFSVEIDGLEERKEEKEKNPNPKYVRAEDFTPSALRKVATSEFFKALMAPLYWSRGDWIKAIAVGFTFYMILKWALLSIFGVPLP